MVTNGCCHCYSRGIYFSTITTSVNVSTMISEPTLLLLVAVIVCTFAFSTVMAVALFVRL